MSDIKDFNDILHRINSASAMFQKGIYHLYFLRNEEETDTYAKVLRLYQCLFQLCLSQLLLDFDYKLNPKWFPKPPKNSNELTRADIDPAATVKHNAFEKTQEGNFRWRPRKTHRLYSISGESLELINNVVQARHNLIYRPYLLDDNFWNDCVLIDLLKHIPAVDEVEKIYKKFIHVMLDWYEFEQQQWTPPPPPPPLSMKKNKEILGDRTNTFSPPVDPFCAISFLNGLFCVYEDLRDHRPTETLLMTYARMLNPSNDERLQSIREYRNQILGLEEFVSIVYIPREWRAGEL